MKFEIVKYQFQMVDGDPKIVISMVKQLDDEGKYIKFAKMKDAVDELAHHAVTFKPLESVVETPSRPYPLLDIDDQEIPF